MARKTAAQAAQAVEDQIKDQAFSELTALIEESDKLLKSSAALVGEEGETLREQVAIKLKQALDSVSNVRERSKPVVDATETYIGGHPWQTVAISAGFGLVVGLLLGRRLFNRPATPAIAPAPALAAQSPAVATSSVCDDVDPPVTAATPPHASAAPVPGCARQSFARRSCSGR